MIASVLDVPKAAAHSWISFASVSVSRIFKLIFLGFSFGGRPVLGLTSSPHFLPSQ